MLSVLAALVFVGITVFMSILSVPAALLDRSGKSYLWLARVWSRIFLRLFNTRLTVRGTENISQGTATVYVANHSSLVDAPAILASVPDNIRLMFRDTLTKIPVWGWALRLSPFLLISRTSAVKAKASLDNAIGVIRNGASVLLFPEGTRTSDGAVQTFKRGAFKMAVESGARVIPVAIKGTFEMLPRTGLLPHWGNRLVITIGEPIQLEEGDSGRSAEIALAARAETAIRALLLEA